MEKLQNEIWKDVVGFEGLYQVSNLGRIYIMDKRLFGCTGYRLVKGKIAKLQIDKKGYFMKMFTGINGKKNMFIHRAVAMAFIPNPENKPAVNHLNGIRTDNRVDNIEWCTYSENNLHAFRVSKRTNPMLGKTLSRHHGAKKVIQYSLDMVELNRFDSYIEAGIATGVSKKYISAYTLGKSKNGCGFIWKTIPNGQES